MSTGVSKIEDKVAEMRQRFDESFAIDVAAPVTAPEPMLAITEAGGKFALRVREISGLAMNRQKTVQVPSRVPELLGLTGVRGIVVPVFSLGRLLGLDSERGQALWLIFCGEKQNCIALAFEAMEGLFQVPSTEIFARDDAPTHRYVNATVCEGTTLRSIINVSALMDYIRKRAGSESRK